MDQKINWFYALISIQLLYLIWMIITGFHIMDKLSSLLKINNLYKKDFIKLLLSQNYKIYRN